MKKEKDYAVVFACTNITQNQASSIMAAATKIKGKSSAKRGTIFLEDIEIPKIGGRKR